MHFTALTAILSFYVTFAVAQNDPQISIFIGNDPFGGDSAKTVASPPARKLPPPPPGSFRSCVDLPAANAALPAYVKAEPGKLTLFADFDHPEEHGIPLFLINRTGRKIHFDNQSSDVYIKLERQTQPGRWERAQAHQSNEGGCGVGGGPVLLLPGMHFRMLGFRPAQGKPAKVRYTCYGSEPCVSNVGKGLYSLAEVTAAQEDGLTRRRIPNTILGEFDPENPFAEPKIATQITLLKMAELLGESPCLRSRASHWLTALEARKSLTAEQKLALPIVRKALDHDWGWRRGHGPLLQACLAALKAAKPAKPEIGSLDLTPDLAWQVIRDLARIESHHYADLHDLPQTDAQLWKEAMTLAAAQVLKAPSEIAQSMTELFRVTTLVNDFLPDEALEPLLASESYELRTLAANALARRGKWERLAELGFKLDADKQLTILFALAQGPYYDIDYGSYEASGLRVGPGYGDLEKSFWLHVIQQQPVGAAETLSRVAIGESNPFDSDLFEALRTRWAQTAQQSDRIGKDFELKEPEHLHPSSLNFLADLQDPKDLPLLHSLLRHRGYITEKGTTGDKPYAKQEFVIRRAAAEALKKRGETLPVDLMLEMDVMQEALKHKQ